MGAYLSAPVTEKVSFDDENTKLSYGASSMQGWRVSQEDSHNCVLNFDESTSLFAVYDGHGGAEVAKYCSVNFPHFVKTVDSYQSGDVKKILVDAYLEFDLTLKKPEVMTDLKALADDSGNLSDEADCNEVDHLYQEATMPIKELMERYSGAFSSNKISSPMLSGKKSVTDRTSVNESSVTNNGVDDNSEKSLVEKENSKNDLLNDRSVSNTKKEIYSPDDRTDKESKPVVNGTASDDTDLNVCTNGNDKASTKTEDKKSRLSGECGVGKSINDRNSAVAGCSSVNAKMSKPGSSKCASNVSNRISKELRPKEPIILLDSEDDDDDDDDESDEDQYANIVDDDSEDDEEEDDEEMEEEDDEEDDDDDDDDEQEESAADGNISDLEVPGMDSGCTAVVAMLKDNTLYVANAGDSRCIVSRKGIAVEMSCDHKPEDELEKNRIEAAGGHVTSDGRVNGGLNLSRAIGDHRYKQNEDISQNEQMISAEPDIQTLALDPVTDEFIVLACDGIWNTMSSQEVVDFVKRRINSAEKLSTICEELSTNCLAPNTCGDGTGCDNMTSVIVKLKSFDKPTVNSGKITKRPSDDDQQERSVKKTKLDQ